MKNEKMSSYERQQFELLSRIRNSILSIAPEPTTPNTTAQLINAIKAVTEMEHLLESEHLFRQSWSKGLTAKKRRLLTSAESHV
jgi:hypothetical protein